VSAARVRFALALTAHLAREEADALLDLGARHPDAALPPSVAYFRDLARSFVAASAASPNAPDTLPEAPSDQRLFDLHDHDPREADRRYGLEGPRHEARVGGGVSSVVDLLQGRLPKSLLEALADRASGLFPSPREIDLSCSCPDWASMCKHVAAALYGVGARLDTSPELFFVLRGVEVTDLAARGARVEFAAASDGDLAGAGLGALFGIELDAAAEAPAKKGAAAARKPKSPAKVEPAATTARARPSKALAAPPPAPTPAPAKPRTRAARTAQPRAAAETVTRASLLASGMTVRTITAWVRSGALEATGDAGTYL
jgi:hypothetical protein